MRQFIVFLVVYITIAFGVLRFTLPVSGEINQADVFKDLAHVFVGGLFGAAIALTAVRCAWNKLMHNPYEKLAQLYEPLAFPWGWWLLAVGLTVLEVVAAIVRKGEA